MKDAKAFKVGDKVFGKVKGYPAWPATIVGVNGKKYDVKFYGTGETGSLQVANLFYYLENRSRFVKPTKRKDFTGAVAEIEMLIKAEGGDGSGNTADSLPENSGSSEPETAKSATSKRKRSISKTDKITPKKAKTGDEGVTENDANFENNVRTDDPQLENANDAIARKEVDKTILEVEENNETAEKTTPEKKTNGTRNKKQPVTPKKSPKKEENSVAEDVKGDAVEQATKADSKIGIVEEVEDKEEEVINKSFTLLNGLDDYILIPDLYLKNIIAYAQKLKEDEEKYKAKQPDPISLDDPNETRVRVLPIQLLSKAYIGLKYLPSDPSTFKNELSRALDDEKNAETLLQLKKDLTSGKKTSYPDNDIIIADLGCDEATIKQLTNMTLVGYKKRKLEWLKRESELCKYMIQIKKCLGLDRADPEQAVKHLDALLELDIDPLSLKKHYHHVESLRRLQRYVGNLDMWQMSKEETEQFKSQAGRIRELADKVHEKYKKLFPYKDDASFKEAFKADCNTFLENTKHLTEVQIFSLCAEPDSRKAILDQLYDNVEE